MSVVDVNNTISGLTDDQKLDIQVKQFLTLLNEQYKSNLRLFNALVAFVWLNPKWTPQQVFDKFGTNSVDLCKLSAAFVLMLNYYTGQSLAVVPASFDLTPNGDGTVTVTAKPQAPQMEKAEAPVAPVIA